MELLYRKLTNHCVQCGQKLNSSHPTMVQVSRINERVSNLTKTLGRAPMVQNCNRCQRIIFEGESGFAQRGLLVDIL